MDKKENFNFQTGDRVPAGIEEYIEGLFNRWDLNEVYLGNINTCFANLAGMLSAPGQTTQVNLEVLLQNDRLTFKVTGIKHSFLKRFLNPHVVEEVRNDVMKSVFLIQRICDDVRVEDGALLLTFHVGSLPDYLHAERTHLFNPTHKAQKYTLND